ncbi:glutathione S-transferase [Limnobacter sp.]|uniref:glutathione S-transferase n=1 Tax=Limnobacter sp. TaxID=2003368 RepID=UPI003511403C
MGAGVEHALGLPVLYTFRRCPYAMRARLAIVAAGLQVEARELVLRDKPAHMLEISPKGTVPVLWLQDGTVIDESLEVMQWALQQHYPDAWLRPTAEQQQQINAWVSTLDGPFKHHLDRYKYPNRYNDCDPLPHREACVNMLKQWDVQLQNMGQTCNSPYLLGGQPSAADCAVLPFVRQFRIADEAWFDGASGFEHVQAWLYRFLNSDWLANAMPKLPLWAPGAEPTRFPA